MTMLVMKLAVVVVMCMVMVAPYAEGAITCPKVRRDLIPCLNYLRNGGSVPRSCCNGVRSLNNAARTTADRQRACRCLQAAAKGVPAVNLGYAASIPAKCSLNIPYKISPSTDCSKVR
ncbi:unnamed protein product [Ilex paraguariensis]|uniref:Non-specific lipid-transfer protein n=1 Tax=Ilex paraguariensis TaxID=185542 RepID=A0ABC8RIC2_9AQUA